MVVGTKPEVTSQKQEDLLGIKGIDHIEYYASNAFQTAHFFRTAFGFKPIAYAGFETGVRDHVSYVVRQRNVRFVFSSSFEPNSPISKHITEHGDGVKDIAFKVDDAVKAFNEAVKRGAEPVLEPTVMEDENGQAIKATIGICGDFVHSFIQRDNYEGSFLPGYEPIKNPPLTLSTGLLSVDHMVLCVPSGEIQKWVDHYCNVLGFINSYNLDVNTHVSGMHYSIVQNKVGSIKLAIVEPVSGSQKSQIQEFLNYHRGPGIQHVALLTNDMVQTIQSLRGNGIEFLRIPDTYYDVIEDRVGDVDEDFSMLRDLGILIDRDPQGYLMQIFTKPVQSRPTLFLEIIQRNGTQLFGHGNIEALFKAVEREQSLRGNL
ncbi:4-hydroxyphenylpyruvate dioxygenase [Ancylothrix sp. C2]|uniref:4-hydroxyphenylpyruvate dioxygenase n=1 Tax=Ancylothrix sp. D3o TaxID=2953691 RepID=UPI0021BA786C|nr:4-hydroxyphenylpyruvate dioxygenase [Ancylothrix sp. D3o]MCT7949348.1 4-hydroxyphenylpyruvate dioxygenase [Ancylothrix sp. D3o]